MRGVESETFAYPCRNQFHSGAYHRALHPSQLDGENRGVAHDLQELEYDVRALQAAARGVEQFAHFILRARRVECAVEARNRHSLQIPRAHFSAAQWSHVAA